MTMNLNCKLCELSKDRINVVWSRYKKKGDITEKSNVMVIGEAPGQIEDETGLPFVGDSGKMFELMCQSIGFKSHDFYICNVVKCRPPENRKPIQEEIKICSPYLFWQILEVDPKIIITLGDIAGKVILSKKFKITQDRGKIYDVEILSKIRKVLPMFHPSYLLRSDAIGQGTVKEKTWKDMILLKELIKNL